MNRSLLLLLLALLLGGIVFFAARGTGRSQEDSVDVARPEALGGPLEPTGSTALAPAAREPDLERAAAATTQDPALAELRARARGEKGPEAVEVAVTPYVGRVLDESGAPIAGAPVELRPWERRDGQQFNVGIMGEKPWPTGETDSEGRFQIKQDSRIGKIVGVAVTARGYVDEPVRVVVEDASSSDLGDVQLETAVIVQGWVRDDRGLPVEEAEIRTARDATSRQARMARRFGLGRGQLLAKTDRDGFFELPHARAGELALVAEHPAHFADRWDGEITARGGVQGGVEFTLERGGVIRGVVDGFPAGRRGAQVVARLVESSTPSDDAAPGPLMRNEGVRADIADDGSFEVQGLAVDATYRVGVNASSMMRGLTVLSESIEVASGSSGVVLEYDAGATLKMKLIDRATLEPIEQCEVFGSWVLPGSEERRASVYLAPDAVTRPDRFPGGLVTLYELRPPEGAADLELTVEAPGYISSQLDPVAVTDGTLVDLDEVVLAPSPQLRLRVLDASTGSPIHRAQVTLRETVDVEMQELWRMGAAAAGDRVRDRTDRKGRVELDALDVDFAELTVRAKGYPNYRDERFPSRAPAGTDPDAELPETVLRLTLGGTLDLYVVDPEGQPVDGASVRLRRAGATGDDASGDRDSTNGDGLKRWNELVPGTYEVTAYRRGAEPNLEDADAWTACRVASDRTTEIVLDVPAAGSLEGVVYLLGEPLAGASIRLTNQEADGGSTRRGRRGFGGRQGDDTTGSTGRFRLEDINPGGYDIVVRHERLANEYREPVTVDAGHSEIELSLSIATVAGRIVDDEGEPIAGAQIFVELPRQDGPASERQRVRRTFERSQRSAGARTDSEGRFRVEGLTPDRELIVEASATGHVMGSTTPFRLSSGEVREDIELTLARAGIVQIEVIDEAETPIPAFIRARSLDDETLDEQVEFYRDNSPTFDELAPGRWEFWISEFQRDGDPIAGDRVEKEVRAGETLEVELVRRPL